MSDLTKEQENIMKEHYDNPKNNKALENYNARGVGRNPDNWGQVDMYLQIDENEILSDLGYEYKGCPTISFTASVFTEELKGVPLQDALKTTQAELDELNAQSNCDDCIKMILVAFIAANENYIERKKGINTEDYTFNMIETTVPYTEQSCG
ncbi:MAG: iron-sulfur cluster assembly scaffold protein [Arcobacteraceae bacterium]|nr:iron-sulfur cluster assembly scaffold protein [Arcobacteraceae bacterium]